MPCPRGHRYGSSFVRARSPAWPGAVTVCALATQHSDSAQIQWSLSLYFIQYLFMA
jgi:hypothetical protein